MGCHHTAVVEFVQFLDVQAAQPFPLTDVLLTYLWRQRSFSIFTEEEPAANSHAGKVAH